jgi:hypothetical protein
MEKGQDSVLYMMANVKLGLIRKNIACCGITDMNKEIKASTVIYHKVIKCGMILGY